MTRLIILLPFALAACGESAAPPAPKAAALQPGLYEVTSEIVSVTPADDGPSRAHFKAGDTGSEQVCIAAANKDGIPPKALAGVLGEGCQASALMLPSGNITGQYSCKPPKLGGDMSVTVRGTHTADSFETTSDAATMLPTSGDVTAVARASGRRVGACAS